MEDPMDYMDKVVRFVGQCGGLEALKKRLMPEGMVWPHYENGKPVTFDSFAASDNGKPFKVNSVLFEPGRVVLRDYSGEIVRRIAAHSDERIKEVEVVGYDKEPILPKQGMYTCVNDADDSSLPVGAFVEVQSIDDSCEFVIVTDTECGYTWYLSPQNLVHKRPVIDNSGNAVNKGDVFYSYLSRIPRKFVVLEVPDADTCKKNVHLKCHDMTYDIDCVCDLASLTRVEPYQDTLEQIKCDFTSTTSDYWGCREYTCDNCPHQLIDGHKPTDYFDHDSDSCGDAQIMDVIRRLGAFCKKLEKKDE